MAVMNRGMNSLVEIEAARSKFIVVTSPMNYQLTYHPQEVARYTRPNTGHLLYQRLKRPYFALDSEISLPQPTILT